MTEEKIEKQAEEYAVKKLGERNHEVVKINEAGVDVAYILWHTSEVEQAFQDGAKWGMEHAIEWHDPIDDFPEDKRKGDEFYCKLKDETLDMEWYEVLIWDIEYQTEDIYQVPVDYMFKSLKTGKDVSDYVIAWCELPKFKDKELPNATDL